MVTRARQRLVSSARLARRRELHPLERHQPARDVSARHLRPPAHRSRARLGATRSDSTRCGSSCTISCGRRIRGLPRPASPQFVAIAARHGIKPLFVFFDSCWDPFPKAGRQRAPRPGVHNSGWVQSPGAEHLDDRALRRILHDYVTGVLSQFRNDDRVLGWDLWNEPDNPARQYRKVERKTSWTLVAELLPQVFRLGTLGRSGQPLTSGVWHGDWADPQRRSTISSIQLDNSDVITFHCYAEPAELRAADRRTRPAGAADPVHRVHGPAPWAARSGDPADRQAPQCRCVQLGFGRREDADLLCRGTRGSTPTRAARKCGSTTCYEPTDGRLGKARSKRFAGWADWRCMSGPGNRLDRRRLRPGR